MGENPGTELDSHIDCSYYSKKIRGSLSFGGSPPYHTKATTTLRVRVALNILGHGYSKGKSLQVGRIQRRQLYYGYMEPVRSLAESALYPTVRIYC